MIKKGECWDEDCLILFYFKCLLLNNFRVPEIVPKAHKCTSSNIMSVVVKIWFHVLCLPLCTQARERTRMCVQIPQDDIGPPHSASCTDLFKLAFPRGPLSTLMHGTCVYSSFVSPYHYRCLDCALLIHNSRLCISSSFHLEYLFCWHTLRILSSLGFLFCSLDILILPLLL